MVDPAKIDMAHAELLLWNPGISFKHLLGPFVLILPQWALSFLALPCPAGQPAGEH